MYLSVGLTQCGPDLPFYAVTLGAVHVPCVDPCFFEQEPDVLKFRQPRLYLFLRVLLHATLQTVADTMSGVRYSTGRERRGFALSL